jgi:hypothetical protein
MAKKKEIQAYTINEQDNLILMKESDIEILTESDNRKIAFYHNVLGYAVCFLKEEQKKRKDFTVAKAEKWFKNKKDKEGLKQFNAIKEKYSDKTDVKYCGKAFREQRKWFKDTYGTEAYEEVKEMK